MVERKDADAAMATAEVEADVAKLRQSLQSRQAPQASSKTPITTLLLDCDNTLTLTEEHAFAATAQTINTLLADFKIPNQTLSSFGHFSTHSGSNGDRLTADALQALEAETTVPGTSMETSNRISQRQNLDLRTTRSPVNDSAVALASTQTLASKASSSTSSSSSSSSPQSSKYLNYSSASLLADYIGLPFRQILNSILSRHNLTLTPSQSTHYQTLEETNVNRQITLFSPPAEDVLQVLLHLRSQNTFSKIAVVSSSPLPRMKSALSKSHLYPSTAFFSSADLFSACDSLPTPIHKPSPAIYLHTLTQLNVHANECLAVEDSVSGTLAAVRAGIRCLGFVGAYHDPGKREAMDRVLRENGAVGVMHCWSDFEKCLKELVG